MIGLVWQFVKIKEDVNRLYAFYFELNVKCFRLIDQIINFS